MEQPKKTEIAQSTLTPPPSFTVSCLDLTYRLSLWRTTDLHLDFGEDFDLLDNLRLLISRNSASNSSIVEPERTKPGSLDGRGGEEQVN